MIWEYLFHKILDISSVSVYEFTCLIAQYNSSNFKDDIDPRLLDRGYTDDQLEQIRAQFNKDLAVNEIRSLDMVITGNPKRFSLPEFNYIINLHSYYKNNNILPYPGSLSEQPAKIIEYFNIIDQMQYEQLERERAKANNGKRSSNKSTGRK